MFLIFVCCAQNPHAFRIVGTNLPVGKQVYLLYYNFEDDKPFVDSVKVNAKGEILLQGVLSGPSYGGLMLGTNYESASADWGNSSNLWFTLFEGETMIDFKNAKISVAKKNKGMLREHEHNLAEEQLRKNILTDTDQAKAKGIKDSVDLLAIAQYIKKYPDDSYGLYLLKNKLGNLGSFKQSSEVLALFDPSLQHSSVYKNLRSHIESLKIQVGTIAPAFSLADVDGTEVQLTDYRGKYVLIDFWASWCVPCRAENPNLVNAYAKFQSHNFEILGISLDNKKEAWLKAIADDKLTWKHVSDLKGWKNQVAQQYGIRGIPANVLIDPNGKILAKNLRAEELLDFLAKTLK